MALICRYEGKEFVAKCLQPKVLLYVPCHLVVFLMTRVCSGSLASRIQSPFLQCMSVGNPALLVYFTQAAPLAGSPLTRSQRVPSASSIVRFNPSGVAHMVLPNITC
jgi:hypothetical protein